MHRHRVWDWMRRMATPASGQGQGARERSGGWLGAARVVRLGPRGGRGLHGQSETGTEEM